MSTSRAKFAVLLIAGAVAVAIAGVRTGVPGRADTPAPATPPVPEVDVAAVLSREVTDWQTYSGRLEPADRVDIRPQVSGTIVAVHFRNGALAEKGDVLFTIDPRPYLAEVARAEAQVAAAQARVRYAAADLDRAWRLVKDDTISRRSLDEKENAAREANAALKAAQAALDIAQLNLGHTQIRAPVSGRVSRAEFTVGNVVTSGAAAESLTTLVSVSPVFASFDVDEQTYLRTIAPVRDSGNIPVQLGLANESGYPRDGTIEYVDNRLNSASGTIRVRATFDNPDGVLIPGLYARIRVGSAVPRRTLLVDDRAVGTDQDKKFVLVVNAQDGVEYREVVPGPLWNGLRAIRSGLAAGERIVVNGLQHARSGSRVSPRMVAMGGEAAPAAGNITASAR